MASMKKIFSQCHLFSLKSKIATTVDALLPLSCVAKMRNSAVQYMSMPPVGEVRSLLLKSYGNGEQKRVVVLHHGPCADPVFWHRYAEESREGGGVLSRYTCAGKCQEAYLPTVSPDSRNPPGRPDKARKPFSNPFSHSFSLSNFSRHLILFSFSKSLQ